MIDSCRTLDAEVIVADNASSDGSAGMLAKEFPAVRVIALEENYGFTGGYNKAVAQLAAGPGAPEYIVLANSDLEVGEGWLEPLVGYMDTHPDCAACGPKIHALEACGAEDAREYRRSGRFEYAGAAGGCLDRFGYPFCRGRVGKRTEEDRGQYDSVKDVMWVSGACMLVRTAVWTELGGLDARFFAHMEEIDFCWRAQLAGYRVALVPQSTVWHLGGGTLPQDSPLKLKLNYRNNLLMLDNNLAATAGRRKAAVRIWTRKALDLGSALVYLLQGRRECFRAVLDAHREYRRLSDAGAAGKAAVKAAGTADRHSPAGPYGICILLQAALRGDRIFEYLMNRYENCN